jgi:tetratricopeptide (TPR) repeat protein
MRPLIVVLALQLPILLPAPRARAFARSLSPDYEAAKARFLKGKDLFLKRQYLKAAEEFEGAYDITKDPVVLFNVGEAYEKAGRLDDAIRAYEGYLLGTPAAQDREEVEKKLIELKKKRSAPPAAESTPPTTTSPPTPLGAQPGTGDHGGTSDKPPAETGSSRVRIAAWVGVGVTAAFLTAAGMLALSAQSRQDDIARMQSFTDATGRPLEFNSGDNKKNFLGLFDDGNTYKDASIVMFILAGAAAAGTVGLFWYDYVDGTQRASAPTRIRFGAIPLPGGAQVGLGWGF